MGWLRVLSKGFISFVYWPRKKLISQLIQFILVFFYDPTQLLQVRVRVTVGFTKKAYFVQFEFLRSRYGA